MLAAAPGRAASGATVMTNKGCYVVGQRGVVTGAGFAPRRRFDVALDGVDLGQSNTSATGSFRVSLFPGPLPAGRAQSVDQLDATDGTSSADTTFTLTRPTGFRFMTRGGDPHTLRAPIELWGFSRAGVPRALFLHYVTPSGRLRRTLSLGHTRGQCGYLRTRRHKLFPFASSPGTWTLQADTQPAYARRPGGPVARIRVQVR